METRQWYWEQNNLLAETDELGAVEARYVYEPEEYGNLVAQRREDETSWYHFDALGTAVALTDQAEVVTDRSTYDAWGKEVAHSGATANPFRWVGEQGYYWDEATARFNLRRREYLSNIAKFLSPDPKGFEAGDANLTRYVGNDPVTQADPSGLDSLNPPKRRS